MCDILKREFKLSNFGFSYQRPDALVFSQWAWHPSFFVVYRIFTALWTLACLLYITLSTIDKHLTHNIMAFLTIWTYLVLTLYFVTSAIVTIIHGLCRRLPDVNVRLKQLQGPHAPDVEITSTAFTDSKEQPIKDKSHLQEPTVIDARDTVTWYMKITWLLGDVVNVFAIIVTLVYFIALFPLVGKTNFIDMNVHGINTVFVLTDAFLNARPVRLLHVLYPFLYGLLYLIFSVVYWSGNKELNVLYPGVLDWNHPSETVIVVCCLCFIGLPVLQLLHFGIYRLRLAIFRKFYFVDYDDI